MSETPTADVEEIIVEEPTDDELLADLPELAAPTRLRVRQRNVIMNLAMRMRSMFPEMDKEGESFEFDIDKATEEQTAALLDIFAQIDEFAEGIATDRAAYVEWALKADYAQLSALLSRYSSAVGESSGSAS